MSARQTSPDHSARRLFAGHAAISLVPVILIGLLLAHAYSGEAQRRGLAEAQSEAKLIATAVVEPQLGQTDLRQGITPAEKARLASLAQRTAADGTVLRMRMRDLDGIVVFSPDGSGLNQIPESEALDAAKGEPVGLLTHVNGDANDSGPVGPEVVEIYRAVYSHPAHQPIGVLEMYLPYAPIRHDVTAGMTTLYRNLAVGLFALYIVLALLSYTTTRRLRRQSERNAYLAEHDPLTDLPNRSAFMNHVDALTAERPQRLAAVAILDLDRFKDVNDTLGHELGDELLRRLGDRLSVALRPGDVVARLGGDEFGVVLARVTSPAQAESVLTRLRAALAAPITITDLPLTAEVSIGYVMVPDDGSDAQTLLQRADIAMYVAKTSRTAVVRYDTEDDNFDADRLAVVGELARALEHDELVLHYQPKLDLLSGGVHAVEALVRWNHPRHGLLGPDSFLPVAEQTGLIDSLTDWVLREALDQIRSWDDGGTHVNVAINVSARNLTHESFADRVLELVDASGLGRDRISLEITETALFTDIEKATGTLERLHVAGLEISLDDFGQGQTSLGFLSRLPVSELKVDRAFVGTMCVDGANAAIVRSVVELAHNLGMSVVAEGAENDATVEALRDLACDTVQGFAIARPLPADDVATWLEAHGANAYLAQR